MQMTDYNTRLTTVPLNEQDKLIKIRSQVEEALTSVRDNVEIAIKRGDNLDVLVTRSALLEEESRTWHKATTKLKHQQCRKYWERSSA